MRYISRILFIPFAVIAFASSVFALDPAVYLKVLGVDINNLKSKSGDFEQVKRLLGAARQIDSGDAAEYAGRVEYILSDGSQSIMFKVGECTQGYAVEIAHEKDKLSHSVLSPSIKGISISGLRLGMSQKEAEKLFAGAISGGWKVEDYLKPFGMPRLTPPEIKESKSKRFTYHKTVSRDGTRFCDRIWIELGFDSHAKMDIIEVTSEGCDDMPCEGR